MDKTSLGDRMKEYEKCYTDDTLIPNTPTIIRVDGIAFHTLTKGLRAYDHDLGVCMSNTMFELMQVIQNAKFAYTQSDEISFLLTDYTRRETEQWLGGEVQKMCSHAAAKATFIFANNWLVSNLSDQNTLTRSIGFDAKVFQLPPYEVVNYFIWRQKDAIRNSISSHARDRFSHTELLGKNREEMIKMMAENHFYWDEQAYHVQRGRGCYKNESRLLVDLALPLFTENREYIERWVYVGEHERISQNTGIIQEGSEDT